MELSFGALWEKGIAVGAGQAPVARYNRYLRDLIVNGRAKPGAIVSHHLPPDAAPGAYERFDRREPGYTRSFFGRTSHSRSEGEEMKIGIIGSGHIGGTACRLFARAGHEVALSHAHGPESLRQFVAQVGPNACAMTVEEAAAFGDVVLLAIPYGDYKTIPAKSLAGKLVVDAMNYYPQRDGQIDFQGLTSTELVARHLPGARLVKAFNTMHAETLGTDGRPGAPESERLVLYVAGDDASAKETVSRLIREIGFTPVDTGSLHEGGKKQEPGSPVYGQAMKPAEAKKVLSGVS